MTENSIICNIINNSTGIDDWYKRLKALNLRIQTDVDTPDYYIFSYNNDCDFSDPIVRESRGIIIDVTTEEVVCWPFTKFGNFFESYADPIDWNSAKVQQKIDGSIIKLWYSKKLQQWKWSTNRAIDAYKAGTNTQGLSFGELIKQATNYEAILKQINQPNELDKDLTYMFEIVSPLHQIVIRYDETYLYHIGTRNNLTGEELNTDIGIEKPKQYSLNNFDECLEAVNEMNQQKEQVTDEGFVVVDKDFHRIKIKSPEYISVSRLIGKNNTPEGLALTLRDNLNMKESLVDSMPMDRDRINLFAEITEQICKDSVKAYEKAKELEGTGLSKKEIYTYLTTNASILSPIALTYSKVCNKDKSPEQAVSETLKKASNDQYMKIFNTYLNKYSLNQ